MNFTLRLIQLTNQPDERKIKEKCAQRNKQQQKTDQLD